MTSTLHILIPTTSDERTPIKMGEGFLIMVTLILGAIFFLSRIAKWLGLPTEVVCGELMSLKSPFHI
jgi:hypothetical protein